MELLGKTHEVLISPDGTLRLIFADDFAEMLPELGRVRITRASHVEPDEQGRWWADMAPVLGPKLGPFARRGDALRAETDWLLEHETPIPRKGDE